MRVSHCSLILPQYIAMVHWWQAWQCPWGVADLLLLPEVALGGHGEMLMQGVVLGYTKRTYYQWSGPW